MRSRLFTLTAALLLAAGFMIGSANARADNGHLVFSTLALHFENFDDRNALTPGVGWEYSPSSAVGWHAGTLSDSFGYQALYAGFNYATLPKFNGRVRFLLGGTVLHKQYRKNAEPETKLVPFPAVELKMTKRSTINLSGSPQVDIGDHSNNAVIFFQYKLKIL